MKISRLGPLPLLVKIKTVIPYYNFTNYCFPNMSQLIIISYIHTGLHSIIQVKNNFIKEILVFSI